MSRIATLVAAIVSSALTAAVVVFAQDKTAQEGNMPYTPTRAEWISLNLSNFISKSEYIIKTEIFSDDSNPNELTIFVIYDDLIEEGFNAMGFAESYAKGIKDQAERMIKQKGWSSWCKVVTIISSASVTHNNHRAGPQSEWRATKLDALAVRLNAERDQYHEKVVQKYYAKNNNELHILTICYGGIDAALVDNIKTLGREKADTAIQSMGLTKVVKLVEKFEFVK